MIDRDQYRTSIKLILKPTSLTEAKEFVDLHHRHHVAPRFGLWAHGVTHEGALVGVAIVANPVARLLCDGYTSEVSRLCTLGHPNACSMLYSAAWRASQAKGYRRIITYVMEDEHGSSLRASNWNFLWNVVGRSWNSPSRPYEDKHPTCDKRAYGVGDFSDCKAYQAQLDRMRQSSQVRKAILEHHDRDPFV